MSAPMPDGRHLALLIHSGDGGSAQRVMTTLVGALAGWTGELFAHIDAYLGPLGLPRRIDTDDPALRAAAGA